MQFRGWFRVRRRFPSSARVKALVCGSLVVVVWIMVDVVVDMVSAQWDPAGNSLC
jgi:hypothetical protein